MVTVTQEAGAETRMGVVWNLGPVTMVPPGEGRTFRAGERLVSVFRTRQGAVFATQAHCPHRAGPLADGILGGGQVVCPLHGYKFDLTTGQPAGNDCPALATYPVSVSAAGDLLLSLADDA